MNIDDFEDNDIESFLEDKSNEIIENEDFNNWNKNNKLSENGEPVLVFHGTMSEDFSVVNEEYFNNDSFLMGGLYMSNNSYDVIENYSKVGVDRKKTMENKIDLSEDLMGTFLLFLEEDVKTLSDIEDNDDLINLKKIIEDEDLLDLFYHVSRNRWESETDEDYLKLITNNGELFTEENLNFINLVQEYDESLNDISMEEFRDYFSDVNDLGVAEKLIQKLAVIKSNVLLENKIMPLYIKMEKPCYYGFDNNPKKTTNICLIDIEANEEYEESLENENEYFDRFKELIEKSKTYLEDINELVLYQYSGEDVSIEYIIDEIYQNISVEDEEPFMSMIKNDFSDLVEVNEDNDVSSIVDNFYIRNQNEEYQEESKLGMELIDSIRSNLEFGNDDFDMFIQNLEENFGNDVISMTVFLEKLKETAFYHEETENVRSAFYDVFDGIEMNAYYANAKFWNRAFDDINPNTSHYIIPEGNNIKSAIKNNGEYSINNDDIYKRISNDIIDIKKVMSVDHLDRHVNYLKSNWKNAPKIELIKTMRSDLKNTDAFVDMKNDIIYINKSRMDSINKLEKTIIHETIGHFGIKRFIGDEADGLFKRVAKKYEKDLNKLSLKYKDLDINNEKDKLKLAEEFVAFKSEDMFLKDNFLKRTSRKIKSMFIKAKTKIGFEMKVDEEMYVLLNKSYEKTRKKKKENKIKLK